MIDALNQSVVTPRGAAPRSGPVGEQTPSSAAPADSDAVELSGDAVRHIGTAERPVRMNLVQRIREEIAAGTYLTEEKLDAAIDGLLRDASRRA